MTTLLDALPLPTTGPAARPTGITVAAVKGWHEDPWHAHALRYHDGAGWTDHVTHYGPVPCLTSCRHAG